MEHLTHMNLSPQTMAATRLQSAYRGRRERRNRLTKKKAAIRLQSAYRGRRSRQTREPYNPYPDATRSMAALRNIDTPLHNIDDLSILDKVSSYVGPARNAIKLKDKADIDSQYM